MSWKLTNEQEQKRRERLASPETGQKISAALKGRTQSIQERARKSEAMRGRTLSPEHRAKLSAAQKGRPGLTADIARLAVLNRGKPGSPEAHAKQAAALRGRSQSPEHIERRIAPHRGARRTPETKMKQAEAHAKWMGGHPSTRPETSIEKILYRFLRDAGFTVEPQRSFGRAVVDAYLPDYHLVFEADGTYWHGTEQWKARDARRDAELMERFGIPVVRLTETELRLIGS